jgi:DNA polymerase-3 subunit gamma/tau
MGYLALYREWRPKRFSEIVGQDHVKVTLVNALLQNKVAHAYLFSGPRGTGKTTAAKILAKALNCRERKGAEPCNECESCRSIDQGLALDVLEIDAASNRGIDEIRDLREKVKFAASGGKNKVYIIDEVHMLTPEAFNALLKTLEEPPASVVFVLATTEAHKVPLTILSRVQRFEFGRISPAGIMTRLREVCAALGRDVEDKALQIIAVKAEGGMRDALSILDQCLLQDQKVTAEHVCQIMGMVGETYSADLMDALLAGDYGRALTKLDEGVGLGRDPRQIIRELLEYLRQALLYLAGGQAPLLPQDLAQRLMRQSSEAGLNKLLAWIGVLLKGEGDLKYAPNVRLAAEMILVEAIYCQQPEGLSQNTAKPGVQEGKKDSKANQAGYTGSTEKEERSQDVQTTEEGSGTVYSEIVSKWPQVLEEVRRQKKSTHAFLLESKPWEIKGSDLLLLFKEGYAFHCEKFNQPENKAVVEKAIKKVTGYQLSLRSVLEDEQKSSVPGERNKQEDPYIKKAMELFGPELVQVRDDG